MDRIHKLNFKPCPFCGEHPRSEGYLDDEGDCSSFWGYHVSVFCAPCGIRMTRKCDLDASKHWHTINRGSQKEIEDQRDNIFLAEVRAYTRLEDRWNKRV